MKGEGNQQDYGMRVYDPRVGRFLSVDPLTGDFADQSSYGFAANSPLLFVDAMGLSPEIGDPPTKTRVRTYIRVRTYRDVPELPKNDAKSIPRISRWSTLFNVTSILGNAGSIWTWLVKPANYDYAGPGASDGNELSFRDLEIVTSDPSTLTDYYLQEVRRRLEGGTISDQERKYVGELVKRGMLSQKSNETHNLTRYEKMKTDLAMLEKTSLFYDDGSVRPEAVAQSVKIIKGSKLGNEHLKNELTSDGSDINDWDKMSLQIRQHTPAGEKVIDVHYYYNSKTGKTYLDGDYKSKLSSNYYDKTVRTKK